MATAEPDAALVAEIEEALSCPHPGCSNPVTISVEGRHNTDDDRCVPCAECPPTHACSECASQIGHVTVLREMLGAPMACELHHVVIHVHMTPLDGRT